MGSSGAWTTGDERDYLDCLRQRLRQLSAVCYLALRILTTPLRPFRTETNLPKQIAHLDDQTHLSTSHESRSITRPTQTDTTNSRASLPSYPTSASAPRASVTMALDNYYQNKIEAMKLEILKGQAVLRRLEAQRNDYNSRVRLLREELGLLQQPGSYVGEVVKVMSTKKVLVKVHPEGKYGKYLNQSSALFKTINPHRTDVTLHSRRRF